MRKLVRVAIALTCVSMLLALASPATANHSWGSYHWARGANPFTLKLGDNVTSQWDAYLNEASRDWSASSVLDTTVVAGNAGNVKRCNTTTGRVEICNAKYGFNGWLGIAGISLSGGHIVASYVKMNDSYFSTASYNTPSWRLSVMCQEIGHAFGLDHQDENFSNANLGSCMDYTNDPDASPNNLHPNQHDFDQLEAIYAHLDSNTTVGAAAPASGKSSSRSRIENVDEHGNGTVTFITWAE